MPAFFGNLNIGEVLLILVVAVVVFGKDLPRVVVDLAGHVHRAKRALSDLRRETGIDQELRQVDYTVRRAAREAQEAMERRALQESPPGEADATRPGAAGERPVPPPARDVGAKSSAEPGESPPGDEGSHESKPSSSL
jgi:Sec-independent protein translocase protein TatA